jgi:formamidopyrimidine-DNA glycosylase
MPELPDLEVLKENILKKFRGATVTALVARRDQETLAAKIVGTKLVGITRRGKYLVFSFGRDVANISAELVLHLMLNGRLTTATAGAAVPGTQLLSLTFDNREELRLNDRTFWSKVYLGANGHLDKLGVEPDSPDFSLEYFTKKISRSRGQIKPLLMKQEFIAGLGNAYTDEALFRARIRPEQAGNLLTGDQIQALFNAIKEIIPWGITEIKKTVGTEVMEDEERLFMSVYRREHQPCPICRAKIIATRVGGRDTFYCPQCQKLITAKKNL